ncbi:MAG: peptide-N-glycosidase F-related protein [Pseudomonadota bacterium]
MRSGVGLFFVIALAACSPSGGSTPAPDTTPDVASDVVAAADTLPDLPSSEDTLPDLPPPQDTPPPQDIEPPPPFNPFSPGPYGPGYRDVAGPFVLPTLHGDWDFEMEWTGEDIYVFVFHHSDYDYSNQLWASSVAALLDKSPQNAHYFFCSYQTDAAADVQTMSVAMGQALDQLVPEKQAWWVERVHFVTEPAFEIPGAFGAAVQAHSSFAFAIDRFQRWRAVGLLLFPGSDQATAELSYLTHEVRWFNFEWARQQDLDGETDVTVIPIFGGENVKNQIVEVELPDAETMAGFDTMLIDLVADCPGHDEQNCGEWDYLSWFHLCADPEDPETCDVEVARWITSYGREGRWVTDVSQMLAHFQGGGTVRLRYNAGNSYDTTLSLRLSNRGKGGHPSEAVFLWPGKGAFDENYNVDRPPIFREVPDDVTRVELYALITGHGFGVDTKNCAEFCNHTHQFTINGTEFVKAHPEADDMWGCMKQIEVGTVPNQYGTWPFGRGGWCPGLDVTPFVADVTDALVDGENELTYLGLLDGEPFVPVPANNGGFKGGIHMSSWLIYWR